MPEYTIYSNDDISIHALYERVRPTEPEEPEEPTDISIHALYERVRLILRNLENILYIFQSTHSMKECDGY